MIMLIIIVYLGSKDPLVALLFTIAFIMSLLETRYYGDFDNVEVKNYESEVKAEKDMKKCINYLCCH